RTALFAEGPRWPKTAQRFGPLGTRAAPNKRQQPSRQTQTGERAYDLQRYSVPYVRPSQSVCCIGEVKELSKICQRLGGRNGLTERFAGTKTESSVRGEER